MKILKRMMLPRPNPPLAVLIAILICASVALANPKGRVLHSFAGGNDGEYPFATMIFDTSGNLYGVTEVGGSNNVGTIFELKPSGNSWAESVIYNFEDYPGYGLAFDPAGNLYGTFPNSGSNFCGAIYQLVLGSDGAWSESILHNFSGGPTMGAIPTVL